MQSKYFKMWMENIHTSFRTVCFGVGKGTIKLEEENVEQSFLKYFISKKGKNLKQNGENINNIWVVGTQMFIILAFILSWIFEIFKKSLEMNWK